MNDSFMRRRRWPYVAIVLLLLFGVPFAWTFRPLNGTERKLVGTWVFVSDGMQRMRFREDRRLAYTNGAGSYEEIGTWSASEAGLQLRFFGVDARVAKLGWYARVLAFLERFRLQKPSALRFHDPDRALIYGIECRRAID